MEKETAMKILKELHGKSLFAERAALETIIPELKESEDEKIRNRILLSLKKDLMATKNSGCDTQDLEQCIAWLEKQGKPQDKGEISDGYHTFNELYYYRMLYNAAFFNMLPKEWVHKSKRHNDGEECFGGGWFIVMANLPTGQISNHYELKDWDLFQIPEKEVADKWDGHTPQEAADRLHKYLLEKQGEQKPVLDFKASNWYVSKVDGKIHDMTYNPTDKVEPFDKYEGLTDFERTLADICIGWLGEELGWKQYIKDNADVLLKIAIKMFNSIQDAPFEKKPAWSDEDENYLQSAENACEYQYGKNTSTILWLKSIKNRIGG